MRVLIERAEEKNVRQIKQRKWFALYLF
jgi:hypothetical protein